MVSGLNTTDSTTFKGPNAQLHAIIPLQCLRLTTGRQQRGLNLKLELWPRSELDIHKQKKISFTCPDCAITITANQRHVEIDWFYLYTALKSTSFYPTAFVGFGTHQPVVGKSVEKHRFTPWSSFLPVALYITVDPKSVQFVTWLPVRTDVQAIMAYLWCRVLLGARVHSHLHPVERDGPSEDPLGS